MGELPGNGQDTVIEPERLIGAAAGQAPEMQTVATDASASFAPIKTD
ncbi:MAG: hypothetical protein MJE77_12785 [Proteobacteria bacterium]|nr:hypothetical protein [Pseudomonadota bacterium]